MTQNSTERLSDAPFAVGDVVETIKGAKFWGEVVSVYPIKREAQIVSGNAIGTVLGLETEWRADVRAIAADFLGTIHVYPTVQLAPRSHREAETGVVVKPLEWRKGHGNSTMSRADTSWGVYRVWTYHDAPEWYWQFGGEPDHKAATEDEALAAAQADYEQRILSALASPQRETEGVGEIKLREIVQKIVDDASTRTVCLKPLYDSVDLGVTLLTRALAPRETAGREITEALKVAREAIASVGPETFGMGNQGGLSDPYPLRDELLMRIDAALAGGQ